ncbi:MAG: T9SS type A sorting domain-containing protein [candidate division KSB1 bacterium]|nr:T9SS type A sorting domain-containing protein [candidate division KSB1 bacterium]MDZ7276538.1 T9SS type A sorting domain-containing protein [candidate division KSB1 bacterium]MDZ7285044.1 T9SS type A sorting domain-containing protein [candidate division KSB1 bacterium]MDZ7298076.1 T9SS type A sorting domain-containing protein [candidate division KSB1 bacterium]MDZ7307700.1 T9SS type A sorting domain-containing protein [candidate division KSB1 bacterium]
MAQQPQPATLAKSVAKFGPGLPLIESTYDFMTNNAMGRHLHNYGGGILAVARTASQGAIGTWADRGTFFAYNDGNGFLLPMTKVESARRGWGNLSATADGRSVIVSHGGLEVNVDALQGLGIWTASLTGNFPTGSDLTWPRIVVDGKDYFHVVVTHFSFDPFPGLGGGQYPVYGRSTDGGLNWEFRFMFQKAGAAPGDPPDTTGGLWIGGGDADAYAIDAWGDKVGIAAFCAYDAGFNSNEILFAESSDNGATWTWSNITSVGRGVPPADGDFRPNGHLDLIYDREGIPHIVFENFLVLPDSAGTAPESFLYTQSPLLHWSPTTGVTYVASRADLPDAEQNRLPGSQLWGRGLGSGLYWPSLGVDESNVLYVAFSAPTAGDVDPDSVNYLDIYATASADGGATWGSPAVNLTASPGTEDKYVSVAKLVDDSLRFVYNSDDVNGGTVQPGNQTTPTMMMYYTFSAADIPKINTAVRDRDPMAGLPADYALAQNFPNPFNPTTVISFSLPASVKVKLEVFNALGQKVATLVNHKLPAGSHTATWNAASMPSGIYFYKLEAGSFSQTRKMVLAK